MRKITILSILLVSATILNAQVKDVQKIKIMTLGVFHFAYPNLDAVKVDKENQISVLDEPYQSEIIAIAESIEKFKPTIIAIENIPTRQHVIDSLFGLYKIDKLVLKKDEVYQLGFRIGKNANVKKIACVDDPGRHYDNLLNLFNDSTRLANFENYLSNSPDSLLLDRQSEQKISSIVDALIRNNNPENIKQGLSTYLLNTFKYEEKSGDFTGVDFETGRWFNRNLRIFRNIQRIDASKDDRILLIIGSGHLNLINWFIDTSKEFELVSPLPYLETAKSL